MNQFSKLFWAQPSKRCTLRGYICPPVLGSFPYLTFTLEIKPLPVYPDIKTTNSHHYPKHFSIFPVFYFLGTAQKSFRCVLQKTSHDLLAAFLSIVLSTNQQCCLKLFSAWFECSSLPRNNHLSTNFKYLKTHPGSLQSSFSLLNYHHYHLCISPWNSRSVSRQLIASGMFFYRSIDIYFTSSKERTVPHLQTW